MKQRFESNIYHGIDGCHYWTGAQNGDGYGFFRINGKCKLAHRVSIELYKGLNPERFVVRHLCNNTLCVNPEHLALGTQIDNMQDAIKAGRRKGVRINNQRPDHDFLKSEVKRLRELNISWGKISRQLGISEGHACYLKKAA